MMQFSRQPTYFRNTIVLIPLTVALWWLADWPIRWLDSVWLRFGLLVTVTWLMSFALYRWIQAKKLKIGEAAVEEYVSFTMLTHIPFASLENVVVWRNQQGVVVRVDVEAENHRKRWRGYQQGDQLAQVLRDRLPDSAEYHEQTTRIRNWWLVWMIGVLLSVVLWDATALYLQEALVFVIYLLALLMWLNIARQERIHSRVNYLILPFFLLVGINQISNVSGVWREPCTWYDKWIVQSGCVRAFERHGKEVLSFSQDFESGELRLVRPNFGSVLIEPLNKWQPYKTKYVEWNRYVERAWASADGQYVTIFEFNPIQGVNHYYTLDVRDSQLIEHHRITDTLNSISSLHAITRTVTLSYGSDEAFEQFDPLNPSSDFSAPDHSAHAVHFENGLLAVWLLNPSEMSASQIDNLTARRTIFIPAGESAFTLQLDYIGFGRRFSPDGRYLLLPTSTQLLVFDGRTGEEVWRRNASQFLQAVFSPDQALTVFYEEDEVVITYLEDGSEFGRLHYPNHPIWLITSPDNDYLAITDEDYMGIYTIPKTIP